MKYLDKYYSGINMEKFIHISIISSYNHNYYLGIDGDLLFSKGDDYNTSDWWVINGNYSYYLGQSYCSENNILHKLNSIPT